MCKKCKEHFDKYNKFYSFGLLLIITALVALLFLKVEALDLEMAQQNSASQVKTEELRKLNQSEPVVEDVVIEEGEEGTLPDSEAEKLPDTPAE